MARWPDATWQGLPRNYGPGIVGPIGVTLHHQAGSGNPYQVYLNRGVSAHFWIPKSGRPVQHVDTNQQSWHGMSLNRRWIGVETEGCGAPPHAEPLTNNQLDWFGKLMAWANRVHGVPLQLSGSESTPGLNYHRVAVATGCPCDVRVNARSEILRRARGGAAAPAPGPPARPAWEADMQMLTVVNPTNGNEELWELNDKGDLYSRWRRAGSATYEKSQKRGGGYQGTPSASVINGVIRIYCLRRGQAPHVWELDTKGTNKWTQKTLA